MLQAFEKLYVHMFCKKRQMFMMRLCVSFVS